MARGCEDDLSMTESRIKAFANFFGPSCKAGPWVSDPVQDAVLSEANKNALRLLPVVGPLETNLFPFYCMRQNKGIHRCVKYATIRRAAANRRSIGDVLGRCFV